MNRTVGKNPNIVLVGFMGTGKTAVGEQLSGHMGMHYVDTDTVIEEKNGRSINDIFAQDGEAVFRQLESEVVRKVSRRRNHIISTGGGVVLKEENLVNLKQNGVVFCLTATAEEIYRRIRTDTFRPLLQTHKPLEKIRTMLAERQPYYTQADYMVKTAGYSFNDIITYIGSVFYTIIHAKS